eukprot:15365228-Ditylum_brightwellii.AAC.1
MGITLECKSEVLEEFKHVLCEGLGILHKLSSIDDDKWRCTIPITRSIISGLNDERVQWLCEESQHPPVDLHKSPLPKKIRNEVLKCNPKLMREKTKEQAAAIKKLKIQNRRKVFKKLSQHNSIEAPINTETDFIFSEDH